jgi:hypothetical protein
MTHFEARMRVHLSRNSWYFKRNTQIPNGDAPDSLISAAATLGALRDIENGRSTAVKNMAERRVYVRTEGQVAYKIRTEFVA